MPDALAPLLFVLLIAAPAFADSAVELEVGGELDPIEAATYDRAGQTIGQSRFEIERQEDGSRQMRVTMRVTDGGFNVSEAVLAPIAGAAAGARDDDASGFRIVEQRSQSTTATGETFPLLVIDHVAKRVSCYDGTDTSAEGRHREIEDADRIVNVPMQLFFQPLVRAEVDSVEFQLAMCGKDGPTVYDMIAVRGPTRVVEGREIVEVEYGPNFGRTIAFLAAKLLPSFSFWFDSQDGRYLGHRMPLHRDGPEVTLVVQGMTPTELGLLD